MGTRGSSGDAVDYAPAGSRLIIIANQAFAEWGQVLGDARTTTDTLIPYSGWVSIEGAARIGFTRASTAEDRARTRLPDTAMPRQEQSR
ncbi:MAG: hypothetical protein KBG34_04445, partial [Pseudoxanthomonas sp.]|nr:hypothetical protein [Pseudoxanthomonas sp.]